MPEIFLTDSRPTCLFANEDSQVKDIPDKEFQIKSVSFAKNRLVVPAYIGQKVCAVVQCFRCQRTRCIYTIKPLSSKSNAILREVLNTTVFACGTPTLQPGPYIPLNTKSTPNAYRVTTALKEHSIAVTCLTRRYAIVVVDTFPKRTLLSKVTVWDWNCLFVLNSCKKTTEIFK
jgi:hypothetical protein